VLATVRPVSVNGTGQQERGSETDAGRYSLAAMPSFPTLRAAPIVGGRGGRGGILAQRSPAPRLGCESQLGE
jgi:hypothetical protein